MILNEKLIRDTPNTGLGVSFRAWLSTGSRDEQKIWHKYIAEILDRDYDQLGPLLEKVFRMMNGAGIGVDYELFYQEMELWDDGDKEVRRLIARIVYAGQGGYRPNAGAKSQSAEGAKQPLGISRVAPDVAAIVFAAEGSKTDYVERAIRFYHQHGQPIT